MSICPICEHPKRQAIDAALDGQRKPGVVCAQFRLDQRSLGQHVMHRWQARQALTATPDREVPSRQAMAPRLDGADEAACPCPWCRMSGLQRLMQAWTEANALDKERFALATRQYDVPF